PLDKLFEGHGCSDFEGQLRRVHLMIRTIVDGDPDIHHRIPCHNAVLHGLDHPGLDSGDIFLRDHPTNNGIVKGESVASRLWGKTQFDMPILPSSATLTDKFSLARGMATNGLLIGNLRTRDIGGDVKLTRQTID